MKLDNAKNNILSIKIGSPSLSSNTVTINRQNSRHELQGYTIITRSRQYINIKGEKVDDPTIIALQHFGYSEEQEMLHQSNKKINEYMQYEKELTKEIFFLNLEDALDACQKLGVIE